MFFFFSWILVECDQIPNLIDGGFFLLCSLVTVRFHIWHFFFHLFIYFHHILNVWILFLRHWQFLFLVVIFLCFFSWIRILFFFSSLLFVLYDFFFLLCCSLLLLLLLLWYCSGTTTTTIKWIALMKMKCTHESVNEVNQNLFFHCMCVYVHITQCFVYGSTPPQPPPPPRLQINKTLKLQMYWNCIRWWWWWWKDFFVCFFFSHFQGFYLATFVCVWRNINPFFSFLISGIGNNLFLSLLYGFSKCHLHVYVLFFFSLLLLLMSNLLFELSSRV